MLGWSLRNLANTYRKLGKHEQALEWSMRALELSQAQFPGDSE